MRGTIAQSFSDVKIELGEMLLGAPEVRVPEWQSLVVADNPMGITHELNNILIEVPILDLGSEAEEVVKPNLPWAEEHFLERVGEVPLNPPPSAANWPFAQSGHEEHTKDKKFSHTYPERMWPKYAGEDYANRTGEQGDWLAVGPRTGIRFTVGDLADVVKQLAKSPMTRQAYLPIWFPEDTGAVHGERVPCSLGYHFLIRSGRLSVTYFIRSCDFLRHFPDDVYMAMRLGQWVRDEIAGVWDKEDRVSNQNAVRGELDMGTLTMHMVSLHVFGADMPLMEKRYG